MPRSETTPTRVLVWHQLIICSSSGLVYITQVRQGDTISRELVTELVGNVWLVALAINPLATLNICSHC